MDKDKKAKIYQRYIKSKGLNNYSAVARYMRAKEKSAIDNYIDHKIEMREFCEDYLNKLAEQREIDRVAKEIAKAVDKAVKG